MKSLINELIISYHRWAMNNAATQECIGYHWLAMKNRINRRNKAQVERMERARGLR